MRMSSFYILSRIFTRQLSIRNLSFSTSHPHSFMRCLASSNLTYSKDVRWVGMTINQPLSTTAFSCSEANRVSDDLAKNTLHAIDTDTSESDTSLSNIKSKPSNLEKADEFHHLPQLRTPIKTESLKPSPPLTVEKDELMFMDDFSSDLTLFQPRSAEEVLPNFPFVKKDFFLPSLEFQERSAEENRQYMETHNIIIKGHAVPPPIQKFSDHKFPKSLRPLLKQFSAPTPIQAQGWSLALQGRDFTGIAQAGTGKTLGYLLPALLHISHHQRVFQEHKYKHYCEGPVGVILVPTRELAQQVLEIANEYAPHVAVRTSGIYGGTGRGMLLNYFKKGNTQLVVATPGRLLNYINAGDINLSHCSFVVVDEADRMLDMGLEPQIRSIVALTRPERQTLMFSATWPDAVRGLAERLQRDPVQLTVGSDRPSVHPNIKQQMHFLESTGKKTLLKHLVREQLAKDPEAKILVFTLTSDVAQKVRRSLYNAGISVESIHGRKDPDDREVILRDFRRGYTNVLVATDLISRGLDIPNLQCVINYDYPNTKETYIHRVGRCGREGLPAVAHTFFTDQEESKAPALVDMFKKAGLKVNNQLQHLALKAKLGEKIGKKPAVGATAPFVPPAPRPNLSTNRSGNSKMFVARLKEKMAAQARYKQIDLHKLSTRYKKSKERAMCEPVYDQD